jgi:hypothetical protein
MSLRGLVRFLSLTNNTLSSQSSIPFGISQNDTVLNTTSAIPDLSATADTFGDPGFIKHIPAGVEVCLILGILYMYIHCYVGNPREIYRQWRQWKQQVSKDDVILLDDRSFITSRNSMHSIDCSSIIESPNQHIQIEDEQSSKTNK